MLTDTWSGTNVQRSYSSPPQTASLCSIENLSTVIWILGMSTVVRLEYLFTVWWIRVCPDPIIRVCPDPIIRVCPDPIIRVCMDPIIRVCLDPIILPNPDLNHWFVNREMIKIGSQRLFLIVCFRSLLECLQVFL